MKMSRAMSTGLGVHIVYMIVWQKEKDEKNYYFSVRVLDQFSDTMLC
jgi:hypothetical protein